MKNQQKHWLRVALMVPLCGLTLACSVCRTVPDVLPEPEATNTEQGLEVSDQSASRETVVAFCEALSEKEYDEAQRYSNVDISAEEWAKEIRYYGRYVVECHVGAATHKDERATVNLGLVWNPETEDEFSVTYLSVELESAGGEWAIDQFTEIRRPADLAGFIPLPQPEPVERIIRLYTSSIPGDSRLWAMLSSGKIALTHDGGLSWSDWYEDLPYLVDLGLRDASLSRVRLFPTEEGLYGLFSGVWYTERGIWLPVDFPGGEIEAFAVSPDGSGRLVAVGGDPHGLDNAWIIEGPEDTWQAISAPSDDWATLVAVGWFPEHGLWAVNTEGTLLQATKDFEWLPTGSIFSDSHDTVGYAAFWVGSNGVLRVLAIDTSSLSTSRWVREWRDNSWRDPENLDYSSRYHYPPAYVIPDRAEFHIPFSFSPDTFYRSTDVGVTWEQIDVPGLPDRVEMNDLAVTGDGVVYLATYAGLYVSHDAGETWKPVDQEH